MIISTVPVSNCTPQTIVIGRRGTYETMQIAFDLSSLVQSYGNGVAVLAVKRSQDESAYPAVVTQEDNTLTWTISETDTYYVGSGECQLMWYVDGGLAKTIIYPMVVMRDILATAEEPPDGYENWVEHLTGIGAETQQNAQEAAQSASEAKASAEAAAESEKKAEDAADLLENVSATATTLEPGQPATAEYDEGVFKFGIPKGDKLTYADLTEADKEDLVQGPIQEAQTSAVNAVGAARVNAVNAVNGAGTTQVQNVNSAGTTNVNAVNQAGETQVNTVNQAGATQAQAVEDKGEEVIASIPSDYSDLTAEVDDLTRQLSDVEENQIPELKTALTFNRDNLNTLYVSNMEQGTITTTGQGVGMPLRYSDNASRIRTAELYDCSVGMSVEMSTNYEIRGFECDINNNFLSAIEWTQSLKVSNTSAKKIAFVIRNKTNTSANIIPSEAISAIVYSDFPLIRIPTINSEIDTLQDNSASVYSNVSVTLSSGIYNTAGQLTQTGYHGSVSVTSGEEYIVIASNNGSTSYPLYIFKSNGAIKGYKNITGVVETFEYVTIPDGVDELLINSMKNYVCLKKKLIIGSKPDSKWKGKKIVWFGTSIPAPSQYNAVVGYPEYVGKLLGATVYNEAVGSSCARRGFKTAESEDDPYGWTGMGEAALWNMGSSIAEKNEIITNWESKWRALTGYNVSLTDAQKTKAIACSYENKLIDKYINTTPCDLYVFDHGYNDYKSGNLDANPSDAFDRSTYQGAINTFINAILTSNPKAKIIIISHYETQRKTGLIEMQEDEAKYWGIPFIRICDYLGWAYNRQITSEGYWSDGTSSGYWIPTGGQSTSYHLTELHFPDGIHPNADITGRACMDIANVIVSLLDAVVPSE